MNFFVPAADTAEKAEEIREAVRRFLRESHHQETSERRIYKLTYVHNGPEHRAEVGKIQQRRTANRWGRTAPWSDAGESSS